MKNAVILHGTSGSPESNWFPWLAKELEKDGWKVWVPQLPGADYPDSDVYNQFLLSATPDNGKPWDFNEETLLIGHSSGSVAALRLLTALSEPGDTESKLRAVYLVSAFKDDLNWKDEQGKSVLGGLYKSPLDFKLLRKQARSFVLVHSNDDPYCPLSHASYLAVQLHGEMILQVGQKHFSTETMGNKYREFPFLLELINR